MTMNAIAYGPYWDDMNGGWGLSQEGIDAYAGESVGDKVCGVDLAREITDMARRMMPAQQERCWCGALYLQTDIRCPHGHCVRCAEA